MKANFSRYAHWLGSLFAVLAIIFVVRQFFEYADQFSTDQYTLLQWCFLIMLVFVYSASNFFLAYSWKKILIGLSVNISTVESVRIYGLSQLAKYMPGNIFHLAGRQALGMAAGIPGWLLVKSTVWELGLLAMTGSLFILLLADQFLAVLSYNASVILFLVSVIVAAWILFRFFCFQVVLAFLGHLSFLTISGAIFCGVLNLITPLAVSDYFVTGAVFIIAWLAGLITPGAPAGIGIREAVLLLLLPNMVPEVLILTAVVFGRIITLVGDLLFFSVSAVIHKV